MKKSKALTDELELNKLDITILRCSSINYLFGKKLITLNFLKKQKIIC